MSGPLLSATSGRRRNSLVLALMLTVPSITSRGRRGPGGDFGQSSVSR